MNENNISIAINPKAIKLQEAILLLGKKDQEILKDVDLSSVLNPENKIYFKAEEIAKLMGNNWNGTKINALLTEMEYQIPFRKDYFPTNLGVKSGCLHRAILLESAEKKTSFKFSIMWTIEILDRIKEYLKEKEEKQNEKQ